MNSGREEAIGSMLATTTDETITALRKEVRAGSTGFAETVGLVEVDGPELQRLYALAAELNVAVMMHFQEGSVPGLPRYGIRGFSRIESMLKKFPKTRFVCHASDFWGNIDANYRDGGAYPEGKMHAGGLSDRLLSDYGNMHGDFGAPSGLIQLSRDPEFTAEFLERHKHKLLFGSDCGCADGKGGSNLPAPSVAPGSSGGGATSMQQRMAAQKGLGGKCIARELLNIAWSSTSRDTFHRLAWVNAHRVYRLGKT